jgi:UDP-N-acetyl-D-glucosamine dehydrogenase
VAQALNDHARAIRGSRIAILGVAYKPGVGDLRESPALKIMRILDARGAELVYHDDFVPVLSSFELENEPLDDVLEGADCAVIVTAHPGLDVHAVVAGAPSVVDLRGVTRGMQSPHVVRL